MKLQDFVVRQTQKALMDLIRSVEALPEGRADWVPHEGMRSALSMMQEVAVAPEFHIHLLRGGVLSPGFHTELRAKAESLDTPSACIDLAQINTMQLCSAVMDFPEERLDDEIVLPFGGGITMSMADVLAQHYWNMTYHLGQVNAIQMALGDPVMH